MSYKKTLKAIFLFIIIIVIVIILVKEEVFNNICIYFSKSAQTKSLYIFSYLFSITRRIKLSFLSTNGINAFLCKNNQFSSNKDKQTHTIIKRFIVITIGGNETYVHIEQRDVKVVRTYLL